MQNLFVSLFAKGSVAKRLTISSFDPRRAHIKTSIKGLCVYPLRHTPVSFNELIYVDVLSRGCVF